MEKVLEYAKNTLAKFRAAISGTTYLFGQRADFESQMVNIIRSF